MAARFSNTDYKHWMRPDGRWWYDVTTPQGLYDDPLQNVDAISAAFWLLKGYQFKITRSDDSAHTALLKTSAGCLFNQAFRTKITGYGNFRNGVVWASNSCRGSCDVTYGGQYTATNVFKYVTQSCTADIGGANKISFWCDWNQGDGAVMMIGKGGRSCGRADHGLGITEENSAKFSISHSDPQYDFGDYSSNSVNENYGLNLWVR